MKFSHQRRVSLANCLIKDVFPRMYALETNKYASVSSKVHAPRLDNSFRRQARSGIEMMQLNSLAEISRTATLVPREDRFIWSLEGDGVFFRGFNSEKD